MAKCIVLMHNDLPIAVWSGENITPQLNADINAAISFKLKDQEMNLEDFHWTEIVDHTSDCTRTEIMFSVLGSVTDYFVGK